MALKAGNKKLKGAARGRGAQNFLPPRARARTNITDKLEITVDLFRSISRGTRGAARYPTTYIYHTLADVISGPRARGHRDDAVYIYIQRLVCRRS